MSNSLPDFSGVFEDGDWTAAFESLDPRRDLAYWFVEWRRHEETREFFIRVDLPGGPPDPDALRAKVSALAEAGEANTDYTGSMMWKMRRKSGPPRGE